MSLYEIMASDKNLKRAHLLYLKTILSNMDDRKNTHDSCKSFTLIATFVKEEKVWEFIEKVKALILFEPDKEIIDCWVEVIKKIKNKNLLDDFINFYFAADMKKEYEPGIFLLYEVFDVYYLKFYKELSQLDVFKSLCEKIDVVLKNDIARLNEAVRD
ncbi:hypothetical protein EDEG_01254 [Edhazardia aedis USNM 41457]|uniref:Uncharacterized protein n=1 Tax=Edhazardia aedis (strain USNM 41457) TaxID=1003232 RepID=J8ZXY9_EDHAE|nr:hypothetical protein EDEG_01254 [Edhazardia aedis USNM 41457]|eukprot:EJW04533.1 hypothetical protein EDEG_01254 [Edhazardia aedis USNM 41457]